MKQDDIALIVRSEREILGESLFNSRKPFEKRNAYIHQKMREMARLLIMARAITPLKTTEDLVMPPNFPHVIKAVGVAGYEFKSNSYKTPSLALKLGHSLAKVAGIVQCNAITANRQAVAESAKQLSMRKNGQSPFRLLHWLHYKNPNGINPRFYNVHRMCGCCTSFFLPSLLSPYWSKDLL